MAEKEFFNHDGVIITSSRAVFRDSMYPIHSISAVKQTKTTSVFFDTKSFTCMFLSCIIFTFGIGLVPDMNTAWIIISITVFLLSFLFASDKDTFHIGLHTSGSNVQVYSSPDSKEIDDIVKAINKAIIARG
jgi:hypothetical protein